MGYDVIEYNPGYEHQVAELQGHQWRAGIVSNVAYLAWKHERNPYADRPSVYLALFEGKVVGMRGLYAARWQAGDPPRTFLGPCTSDAVVAPDHRKRGVWRKLAEATTEDVTDGRSEYLFCLSASRVTRYALPTMGWRYTDAVGMARRCSAEASGRCRSSTTAGRGALAGSTEGRGSGEDAGRSVERRSPFRRLDRKSAGAPGAASGDVSVEPVPRPEEMAELVERIGSDGRIRHVRDAEYLAWRFQNPRSVYRFLFSWSGLQLEGYLVLQASAHQDEPTVRIVDWEAATPRARVDLLHAAIRWGDFDDLVIWSATLPNETKALLEETGFCMAGRTEHAGCADRTAGRPIFVRPLRPELLAADEWVIAGRHPLDLADWDLRMIYSDAF